VNIFKRTLKDQPQIAASYAQHFEINCIQTDRVLVYLLPTQWMLAAVFAVGIALVGGLPTGIQPHLGLFATLAIGALFTLFPIWLGVYHPGKLRTRMAFAVTQAIFSVLLIRMTGGRTESHFHIFVSLAVLAAYRDRLVLLPPVLIPIVHQIATSWFQWGNGTAAVPNPGLEHAGWILFEWLALAYFVGQERTQTVFPDRLQNTLQQEEMKTGSGDCEGTRELEDSRTFQEQVLNSIDAMVCLISEDGHIWFVNKNWTDFALHEFNDQPTGVGANYYSLVNRLGWTSVAPTTKRRHEFTGADQDDYDLVNSMGENHAAEFACAIKEIVSGHRQSYVTEFTSAEGSKKFSLQLRASRVPSRGRILVALAHMEITDVKEAQSRAASLAKIILESPNEVFLFRCDNLKYVEVNQGACENLKYSREELISLSPLATCVQLDEQSLRNYVDSLIAQTSKFIEFETRMQRKDGTSYQCNVRLHRCKFDDSDTVMAFVTDLTQHKELEAKLAQSRKMESLGQLAAGIAHEINTPMQCVFGNVEFLQTSMERLFRVTDACIETLERSHVTKEAQETVAELRKNLRFDHVRKQFPLAIDEASDASKRIISIVQAMKIMSHPGTTSKVDTNLHELIRNTATVTQNRWKYVAKMSYAFDSRISTIPAFPAELSQVFINMFVNAADAIAELIGSEPAELGSIGVATLLENDSVSITISDSGCGMLDEVRQKIFDPFFTTKEVGKGTGQGLAISYDIVVNKHGGLIHVTSKPKGGTRFLIRLPLQCVDFEKNDPSGFPHVESVMNAALNSSSLN
jgi:two-component system, NtrC family, sensor kinase